jgi:hypothetical protein
MNRAREEDRAESERVVSLALAQKELWEVLETCLREERRALTTMDARALKEIAGDVKPRILELLLEGWKELRTEIARCLGESSGESDIADGLERLGGRRSGHAGGSVEHALAAEIRTLRDSVRRLQDSNQELAVQGLGWVRACISEMIGTPSLGSYDASGRAVVRAAGGEAPR